MTYGNALHSMKRREAPWPGLPFNWKPILTAPRIWSGLSIRMERSTCFNAVRFLITAPDWNLPFKHPPYRKRRR